jgi:hypothetical protein
MRIKQESTCDLWAHSGHTKAGGISVLWMVADSGYSTHGREAALCTSGLHPGLLLPLCCSSGAEPGSHPSLWLAGLKAEMRSCLSSWQHRPIGVLGPSVTEASCCGVCQPVSTCGVHVQPECLCASMGVSGVLSVNWTFSCVHKKHV